MSDFNKKLEAYFHELETIAAWMQHNDPNGEYTWHDLYDHPLGMESTERERIHIDDMISTLYVALFAHKL